MTDWLKASALDMAAGLRSKAISATELLNVYISRMESVNPAVNALAVERFDEARVEARMADEVLAKAASDDPLPPFFGVPCTIKEFLACTGIPHTAGLLSRKNVVATEDATTVARLKAAGGAVIMGSTNIRRWFVDGDPQPDLRTDEKSVELEAYAGWFQWRRICSDRRGSVSHWTGQ